MASSLLTHKCVYIIVTAQQFPKIESWLTKQTLKHNLSEAFDFIQNKGKSLDEVYIDDTVLTVVLHRVEEPHTFFLIKRRKERKDRTPMASGLLAVQHERAEKPSAWIM